jgi:hypothetical protein
MYDHLSFLSTFFHHACAGFNQTALRHIASMTRNIVDDNYNEKEGRR